MIKRIAILTALIGFSGPAFGQTAQLSAGVPDVYAHSIEAAQHSAMFSDCEQRYSTVRARSTMIPSVRRQAVETCRAIAAQQQVVETVAKRQ